MMKLFKTITSNEACEISWMDDCLGADGIPVKTGIVENCSAIDDDTAYDIYLLEEYITQHDTSKDDWWSNMYEAIWQNNFPYKWTEMVKNNIDKERWLYGLYRENLLVGYAFPRPLSDEEKLKTYKVEIEVTASNIEAVLKELATMTPTDLKQRLTITRK